MARTKLNPEFEIEVDGETYVWRLQRTPHWSKDPTERHGMAIAVHHVEGKREVVIEFPPGEQPRYGAPQLKTEQVPRKLVATAIASALEPAGSP
ncbi:conserved hypothetical protein, partial [Ricinus communis]